MVSLLLIFLFAAVVVIWGGLLFLYVDMPGPAALQEELTF